MTVLVSTQDASSSSRVHRRPRLKFLIDVFPYAIVPFCAAPVWPGESLVNAWFEAREVSPPVKASITGWGSEWYLFYCRLSDLIDHPNVMAMLIDPTNAQLTGSGPYYDTTPETYHVGPYPNYIQMCLDRIAKVYFRDTEEPITGGVDSMYGPYPKAKFRDHGLFDSLTPEAFDDMAVPPAASGMDDLARAADLYEYLVAAQLTDLSYSDWCAAYGVKIPAAEKNEPELLSKWTEWVYPSNTIDPVTGSPSSAISVVVKKNFNEPRYFKEPGFLIGLHIVRPKLLLEDQRQSATSFFNTALAWLPAMLSADPSTSMREFTADQLLNAPAAPSDKYIVDMRDVPVYGDQFTNIALTQSQFAKMSLADGLQYPLNAELTDLFDSPANPFVRSDGFINLDIVGRIVDYTTAHTAKV